MTWTGAKGCDYAIGHSADLATWQRGLPGGVFSNVLTNVVLTFTDATNAARRFYRIRRDFSPWPGAAVS